MVELLTGSVSVGPAEDAANPFDYHLLTEQESQAKQAEEFRRQ